MARTRNLGNLTNLLTAGTTYAAATATPAQFDNSLNLATTAFVQTALGNMTGAVALSGTSTLTLSQAGSLVTLGGTGTYTITLPAPTTKGIQFVFCNYNAAIVTLSTPSGNFNGSVPGVASTYVLQANASLSIIADGNNWLVVGGSGSATLATSGFQKMPSGLIMQWSVYTCSTGGYTTPTFPVAFPNACFTVATGYQSQTATQTSTNVNTLTKTGFNVAAVQGTSYVAQPINYIAIGN